MSWPYGSQDDSAARDPTWVAAGVLVRLVVGTTALLVLGALLCPTSAGTPEEQATELLQINRLVVDARTPRDCEWAYRRAHAAGYWARGREPQLEYSDIYLRCLEWLQVRQEQRHRAARPGR